MLALAATALVPAHAAAVPPQFDDGRSTARSTTTGPWTWSVPSRSWARQQGVLPAALVERGPSAPITRGQFLSAMLRLQRLRGEDQHALMRSRRQAPALPDARANTAPARAVAYGWIPARNGRFDARQPITADEAAIAITSALGLRPMVGEFAVRMRGELPGVQARWTYASAHAISRSLGLRYNVKDPWDRFELEPGDALNVGHGAYMLHAASRVDGWRLRGVQRMVETFDLPELGPDQTRIIGAGVRLLGYPYVWGGETEGRQPEGKGGFDCSGFTIRIVNGSGVAAERLLRVNERTTYTQSAIAVDQRLAVAQLQPADLMFFGDKGPASTPDQNFHVGVYMGNGWFIHSSGGNGGVAIDLLDGWWGTHFSWGRRALRAP
jgi:hypothetical protein